LYGDISDKTHRIAYQEGAKIIAGINLNKIDVRAVTGIVELSGKVIKQVTANTGGVEARTASRNTQVKVQAGGEAVYQSKSVRNVKRRLGKCYVVYGSPKNVVRTTFRWEYNYQVEVLHIGAFAKYLSHSMNFRCYCIPLKFYGGCMGEDIISAIPLGFVIAFLIGPVFCIVRD
jgi:hypothetical protein